jgi:maltose alpha-D-glucosyltransferase/alpha-amylase
MQWTHGRNAGFSSADSRQLYLPVDTRSDRVSVEQQESEADSLLNRVRWLVSLRRSQPALHASSDFTPLFAEAGKLPFVYLRSRGNDRILVALNPASQPAGVELPDLDVGQIEPLFGPLGRLIRFAGGWRVEMPGVSGIAYRI